MLHSYNLILKTVINLLQWNYYINLTKEITSISDEDLDVTMHSRKTLLFHNQEPWVKTEGYDDFDVPIGCYDGAEVCQLVDQILLTKNHLDYIGMIDLVSYKILQVHKQNVKRKLL